VIKIERARLKDHADVEDRVLWGIAYDSGETTINGRKWTTTLALDELGWLHIWRTNSDKETKRARVPPDMIRIVFDAEPDLMNEPGDSLAPVTVDPAYRHPKAIKR
jgi:hypothetical protein